jgi:putative transposase
MGRIARVVTPCVPHHVTQRGNRRQKTFFSHEDYEAHVSLMAEWCAKLGVEVWAYCLMPNHVHLIAVPPKETALVRAVGEAHRRYSRMVNFREGWRGHLWQGRFASFLMDAAYACECARYVELDPVRARLAATARGWRWSSARAHLGRKDDRLVGSRPSSMWWGGGRARGACTSPWGARRARWHSSGGTRGRGGRSAATGSSPRSRRRWGGACGS